MSTSNECVHTVEDIPLLPYAYSYEIIEHDDRVPQQIKRKPERNSYINLVNFLQLNRY